MKTSLWRLLARPTYLVSRGPWIALAALINPPLAWLLVAGVILFGTIAPLMWLSVLSDTVTSWFIILVFFWLLLAPMLVVAAIPIIGLRYGYAERWRLRLMGFRTVSNPHVPMQVRPIKRWLKFRYQEPATWREVLAAVISVFFSVAVCFLGFIETLFVGVFGYCTWALGINHETLRDQISVPWHSTTNPPPSLDVTPNTFFPSDWWQFALALAICLIVFGYLNGLIAAASGSASKALLAPRPEEIQRQVDRLTFSRAAIMESFEAERKRIERDLHDGVQQELVNLSLRLGMADMEVTSLEESGTDVSAARDQIRHAQDQTSHALQTLRNTVRGIYPAVLEDHGLRAALEELANNSMVPTDLAYAPSTRLPADVERTAYYAASEAMTNALKHSTATRLWITVSADDTALSLRVRDNGQGGANPSHGTGLKGLDERARTLDGAVQVNSPVGGPTTVHLRLPLVEDGKGPDLPWAGDSVPHKSASKG